MQFEWICDTKLYFALALILLSLEHKIIPYLKEVRSGHDITLKQREVFLQNII